MGRDKWRKTLAVRLCVSLCTVLLGVQVYMEFGRSRFHFLSRQRHHEVPRARGRAGFAPLNAHTRRQETGAKSDKKEPTVPAEEGKVGVEQQRKLLRWHINLQPWANSNHALEYEAERFLNYITNPQISCGTTQEIEISNISGVNGKPWSVCLDDRYTLAHQIKKKQCRVYSLLLGNDNEHFEMSLAKAGCEVHCFDPSIKVPHLQNGERFWHHRLSVDWRDPNPAIPVQKQHSNTKKLAAILNDFGHRKVDVLKADVESTEWKILENLILENVISEIGQLLFEVHLHWPGFEVSGDDSTVVRYWYSLLKELERNGFRLFHSQKNPKGPHVFLQKNIFNASSSYTLCWVNTRWRR
ncbi:probable methyltransferase-like protein 24 [Erpetoichthys calabaricus]|uniref:probable methyltransferase-like protein 24 n=1 Tax=Erpetoichthys calabaricus TaxID=27687 RepID=UPI0010A03E6F|nr:probable methyltransferase-like protein 24 [Erpetoichthys calabaricus]